MRTTIATRPATKPLKVVLGLLLAANTTAVAQPQQAPAAAREIGAAQHQMTEPQMTLLTEKVVRKKMGSRFEITAVHQDRAHAALAIEAAYQEIDRLEGLISSWSPTSQTSEIVRHAGQRPVVVDRELLGLVRRALKVGELTGGAYDITFSAAGDLWDFAAKTPGLPEPETLAQALALVDYSAVEVDESRSTVFLPVRGMKIGFGGIGKGFAANRARAKMLELGIESGVVNAGGDLLAFGHQADGSPWTVVIADPQARDQVFAHLSISNQAVVTSGDYESYFELEGTRYAHILDPQTGFPTRGIVSVTVLCPDAELADALATSVFVMGAQRGLALVDRLKGTEALIVTDAGELLFSKNLKTQFADR